MNWRARPLSVIIVACLYLAVGSGGFVYHLRDIGVPDGFWIEVTEFLAFFAGASLLFAQNRARWLAVAWMAFHVVLSFGSFREVAVHSVFLAAIACVLFRPAAAQYFRRVNA